MILGEMFLKKLQDKYEVREVDLKDNALLKKSGLKFALRSYEVKDIGHFFIMDMTGMLGAMKMETVVLATMEKNLPLVNIDYVNAMGKETMMAEYYDTDHSGLPEGYYEKLDAIRLADSDIEDTPLGEIWYSEYLLPCSYRKEGKKLTERFVSAGSRHIDLLMQMLEDAPEAQREEMMKKSLSFAQRLLDEGGPAINQFVKLFGRERTEKIVKECMYGAR